MDKKWNDPWLPGAVWEPFQMLEYDFKFISSSTLSEDWNMKSERRLSPQTLLHDFLLALIMPVLANLGLRSLSYKQLNSTNLPICINR